MKKRLLVIALVLSAPFYFSSCDTLAGIAKEVLLEPTADEIGRGLKEALDKGITKGVERLSARDGYYRSPYKILLPAEARQVTDRLKAIPGFEKLEENLLEKINYSNAFLLKKPSKDSSEALYLQLLQEF